MKTTLCRIVKYAPAVVMVLLVVVWLVSAFQTLQVWVDYGECTYMLENGPGHFRLYLSRNGFPSEPSLDVSLFKNQFFLEESVLGFLGWGALPHDGYDLNLPYALLMTAILPLAIGSITSFRFRLWHYLAYTALVAVELAYYLRWQ
jgi:hypothetical protein